MGTLFIGLLPVIFIIVFIVAMVVIVIRRGFQVKLLVEDGIDATGTVVRKVTFRSGKGSRSHRIKYEYFDDLGRRHEHRSMVTKTFYDSFNEGSPIPVVYSRSKPQVSAPKELVEQAREGYRKRSVSTGR